VSDDLNGAAVGTKEPADAAKPPPKTLDETIAEAQAEADTRKAAKEKADSESAASDGRLAALLALKKDSDKAVQTYTAAHEQLTIDQQAFEDYDDSARQDLEKQLKDAGKAKVTKLAADKRKADDDRKKEVATAQDNLQTAKDAATTAEQDRKAKADVVTQYKQLATTISARHATLKALRDEVTKARQVNQPGLAFWLLVRPGGFGTQLADADTLLIDPEKLPAQLLTTVSELAAAETAKAAADAAVVRRQAELATAQRALADQLANGEKQLRADLAKIPAAPAPAYAAPAATA
jgi:hypothetical protein